MFVLCQIIKTSKKFRKLKTLSQDVSSLFISVMNIVDLHPCSKNRATKILNSVFDIIGHILLILNIVSKE